MPRDYARTDRIAEQIQRELAELVRLEVKDPRVRMLTLTGVEVARDYSHAKVFYTVLSNSTPPRTAPLSNSDKTTSHLTKLQKPQQVIGYPPPAGERTNGSSPAGGGGRKAMSAVQEGLECASGFLRSQLAHRMKLRITPQLHFVYDASVERGAHLSQLIDQAVASDKSREGKNT
jgi:ribosome-binding factor A